MEVCVFFREQKDVRSSRGPSVVLRYCQWGWKGRWEEKTLRYLRKAFGDLLPMDDDDALRQLNGHRPAFIGRATELLECCAARLVERGVPVPEEARLLESWALDFAVARLEDLAPDDADVEEVTERYEQWIFVILETLFELDLDAPRRELERLLRGQ